MSSIYTIDVDGRDYYYIHRHLIHFPMDSATRFFQEQREKNYVEMRNRYKKNFQNSISINSNELGWLDTAMGDEDQVINAIDQGLLDSLNEKVGEAIENFDFEENLKKAYTSFENYINTKDVQELSNLLSTISEVSTLLEENESNILIGLLKYKDDKTFITNIPYLSSRLNKKIRELEGKQISLSEKRLLSILISLKKIVQGLNHQNVKPNKLKGSMANFFSSKLGEYAISKALLQALSKTADGIEASLRGSDKIKLEDPGVLAEWKALGSQSPTFKTDNTFKDLDINISVEGGDTVSLTVDLGISTKWYKEYQGNINDSVGFVNEKSFEYRLNQMLSSNLHSYYAYNALGFADIDSSAYKALKAAMISRNLDSMISGFGKQGDFSQYIVVNGKFYSIWQLISTIQDYRGNGTTDEEFSNDAISISVQGLSKVIKATDEVQNKLPDYAEMRKRVKMQNEDIAKLRFVGRFYPSKLMNLVKK